MLSKKVIKYLSVFFFFVASIIFVGHEVGASNYRKYCFTKVEGTNLYDCGNKIYTYYEDKEHSSYIVSLNESHRILYAGEVDGIDLFYVNGVQFNNVSYDDQSRANNNIWTTLTSKGKMVFDGSFKDTIVDDSHSGYYRYPLGKEIYTIRQYHNNGELYRTIAIYQFKDSSINFISASYDNNDIIDNQVNEVLSSYEGMEINIDSKYGVKNAEVKINDAIINLRLKDTKLKLDAEILNKNLVKGKVIDIKISLTDYLGNTTSKKYQLKLLSNDVVIDFSTMTSIIESNSRRIVIDAAAGKGKTLDTDYCWYYWSTNPDDSLVYEEFLKNYANSEYKGSYSSDKGVILRNTSGTYYLYAMAKDDDSVGIVRSEGYVLNGESYTTPYNLNDAIFVLALLIIAIIPILVYVTINKKGY